jgi:hypothetical protein
MKTIKITLEGEPEFVEAVARLLPECLDVAEEGKNQSVALRPGVVRRVVRVYPPTDTAPGGGPNGPNQSRKAA